MIANTSQNRLLKTVGVTIITKGTYQDKTIHNLLLINTYIIKEKQLWQGLKPNIIIDYVDKKYNSEQILEAHAIYAVFYEGKPINIRTLNTP